MKTSIVEEACVFLHDAMQMMFAQYDEVIQTYVLETTKEMLADSIGLRSTIGSAQLCCLIFDFKVNVGIG